MIEVRRQCHQLITDGSFGVRNCSRKPAAGDTLCKRHRANAAKSGYMPAREITPTTPSPISKDGRE
jgi:hypothetical protein